MIFSKDDTKIIKAIAIVLMLYHHLFQFPKRINYEFIPLFIFNNESSAFLLGQFGKLCVGIFLFLGGYGTYKSYKNNDISFLKNKIFRLYSVFWKAFFICVPISILLNIGRVKINFSDFFYNFTALKLTYNGEWWFLTPYIILTLISPFLIKFINKKFNDIIFAFVFIFLLNGFIFYIYPQIFNLEIFNVYKKTLLHRNISTMLHLLPIFICGIIFAKFDLLDKIKTKFCGNYLIDIVAVFTLFFLIFIRKNIGSYYDFIYTPIFVTCCAIILVIPILKYFKILLIKIGEQSTNIWLTHSFFCYMWCQKFIFLPKYSILIFLLLLIVSFSFGKFIDFFYKILYKLFQGIILKLNFNHKII